MMTEQRWLQKFGGQQPSAGSINRAGPKDVPIWRTLQYRTGETVWLGGAQGRSKVPLKWSEWIDVPVEIENND